jgi:peptidoglycan-associated lipoprotein
MKNIKLWGVVLSIVLFTACSSKTDSITYNNEAKETKAQNNVDKKLSNIKAVDTNNQQNNVSTIDEDTYINSVTSIIDGQEHSLTSIHFGFDNYKMRDDMITISSNNANKISEVLNTNSTVKVKIEGNCDEWGSDEYNFALGLKRAKVVKTSLIDNGIKASNIVLVSLGESNPICSDRTAKCWKKNRRVDHKLLP